MIIATKADVTRAALPRSAALSLEVLIARGGSPEVRARRILEAATALPASRRT